MKIETPEFKECLYSQHTVAVLRSRNDDRTRRRGRKPKLDSLQLDKMRF